MKQDQSENKLDNPPPPHNKGNELMEGKRILSNGILSKTATYRVVVGGKIGVKEIERLIAKLELDKEIFADEDNPDE